MIKKIVHIADIHIPNTEDDRPYSEMIKQFLAELLDTIKDYKKDEIRIVLAGDIFHQKIKATNEAKTMFHMMLNYLNQFATTIVIAGNHDLLENNKSRTDSIAPTFEIINAYPNVRYLDKELGFKSGYAVDDNIIWRLYSIYDGYATPNLSKDEIGDRKVIGLYHGNIVGAVTDIGRMMEDGIDVNGFDGCDCVMAGHIHKQQEIRKNGIPIVYAGSLFQQDCGENTSRHGFLIWDVETMTYEHHEVTNNYRIHKFTISSYEDIENDDERLINF